MVDVGGRLMHGRGNVRGFFFCWCPQAAVAELSISKKYSLFSSHLDLCSPPYSFATLTQLALRILSVLPVPSPTKGTGNGEGWREGELLSLEPLQ